MMKMRFALAARMLAACAVAAALIGCGPDPARPPIAESSAALTQLYANVGIHPYQTGPLLCFTGSGFTPSGTAYITSTGVPIGPNYQVHMLETADGSGNFYGFDTQYDLGSNGLTLCTTQQLQGTVSFTFVDEATNQTAQLTVPSGYWCSQLPYGADYNGGCPNTPPPPARVLSISEEYGYTGDPIDVSGYGFDPAPGATVFSFGGVRASSTCSSNLHCSVTVPPGAYTVSVQAFVDGAAIASSATFAYQPPAIVSLSPTSGPASGGTTVTIQGRGLDSSMSVYFNGYLAAGPGAAPNNVVSCASAGSCTMVTPAAPAGPGPVSVTVDVAGVTSAPAEQQFTYLPPQPALAQIIPCPYPYHPSDPQCSSAIWSGQSLGFWVSLTAPAPAGGMQVSLSSSNPQIASVPSSVSIPGGVSYGTFTLTTPASGTPGLAETVILTGSGGGATVTQPLTVHTGQIYLGYGGWSGHLLSGLSAQMYVLLRAPAPAGGAAVPLANSAPAALSIPSSVPVTGGQNSANFTVTALHVSAPTAATVSASYSGTTSSETVQVAPATPPPPPPPPCDKCGKVCC